jgi:hypothetical protein
MFQLTAEEAAKYQDAVRIKGSMLLREVEDDFVDISQGAFPPQAAIPRRITGTSGLSPGMKQARSACANRVGEG